jgi:hypothetical protein
MDEDTLRCFAAISEAFLGLAEIQIGATRGFLSWLDYLERRIQVLRESFPLPEQVAAQLAAIEREFASKHAELLPLIRDALARTESWHERVEHQLARLKAALPPPPDEESPP